MKLDMRKIYRFDPMEAQVDDPLPAGSGIFYECAECKGVVSSVPFILVKCECGNLEGNGGTLNVKDASKVTPMKGTLR